MQFFFCPCHPNIEHSALLLYVLFEYGLFVWHHALIHINDVHILIFQAFDAVQRCKCDTILLTALYAVYLFQLPGICLDMVKPALVVLMPLCTLLQLV